MEKLSTFVKLAAEARMARHFHASNSYARVALGLANREKQMKLAGKLLVLQRKNWENINAGHGIVL